MGRWLGSSFWKQEGLWLTVMAGEAISSVKPLTQPNGKLGRKKPTAEGACENGSGYPITPVNG